jgi:NTP pyrophosphatase (non-canonical NTP hydrolase)
MDPVTTIEQLKKEVQQFSERRDWDQYHNAKELAIGLSTEAGELLDMFRFKTYSQVDELFQDPDRREMIEDEMADIFFFLLRLAQRYQLDLSGGFLRKMAKNEEKYPVEMVRGRNEKYSEYQ